MTVEETEKQKVTPAAQPEESLHSLLGQLKTDDVRKTTGETIHNEITYRGVDWVLNTAFAVGFATLANRTTLGQNLYSNPLQKRFRQLLNPLFKNEKNLQSSAELGTDFTSIMVGGTAIIPIMTYLDKHRLEIAETLDRKIHGDKRVDTDPRFAIRYEALQQRPQKDFWTGMGARVVVLAPMMTAHMNKHTNPILDKYMYQHFANAGRWGAKQLGIHPKGWWHKTMLNKEDKAVSNWDYMMNTFGMDVSLTLIYSYAHEWTFHKLTNFFKGERAADPRQVPADAPTAEPRSLITTKQMGYDKPLKLQELARES